MQVYLLFQYVSFIKFVPPLFAAAVNSERLLGRSFEDGFEDGNVLLKDDGRHGEVPLQLLCALTEILRQVGHVLPLLHLTEKLNQAAGKGWEGITPDTRIISERCLSDEVVFLLRPTSPLFHQHKLLQKL